MGPDFWTSCWEQNRIGFHQGDINQSLKERMPELGLSPGDGIFVPLCGKSLDMLWLRDNGYRVVGVELSPIAIEAFFEENDLPVHKEEHGKLLRYSTDSLEIFCGDFFDLRKSDLNGATGVYDRAACIALPAETRPRYARHLASLLSPGASMLLLSIEYPPEEMNGPPFTVPESEIRSLFQDHFDIHLLETTDALEQNPRFKQRGITSLQEKTFLLKYTR